MLKKLIAAIAILAATMGIALAQVDVNKADQAALDGITGIGPSTSKAILEERKKGGPFKNWADLEQRVKGIGDKRALKLSQAGLTVDGQPKTAANPEDKKAMRQAKVDAQADKGKMVKAKADAKDVAGAAKK